MEKKKTSDRTEKITPRENKNITQAHNQAEKDIESDPDLNTKPNREDDLDEGELAQLEGED